MYLTALHVVDPATGQEGVNAYYYEHRVTWDVPPPGIPDQDPGELVAHHLALPTGGNRVRAFLDVVAPDEATWTEIRQSFVTFVSATQLQPFPRKGIVGRCLFRIGLDFGLAAHWHREIAELYREVQAVRVGG